MTELLSMATTHSPMVDLYDGLVGLLDAFFGLPWRAGPALVVLGLGLLVTVQGVRAMPNPCGPTVDLMVWMQGFRRTVVGLALVVGGLAWLWQLPWLLAIALGVGLQELREASSYISTLRHHLATRRRGLSGLGRSGQTG